MTKKMYTIEFTTKAQNGAIILPEQLSDYDKELKVTLSWEKPIDYTYESRKGRFSALKLNTKGFKFNRDEANER